MAILKVPTRVDDDLFNLQDYKDDLNALNTELASKSVNVKNYGAKGDGVADDTSAVQNAINSIAAGGILFLPKGIYVISAPLEITNSNIMFLGAGKGNTIIKQTTSNKISIYIHNASGISNVTLKDFTIDANGFGQADTGALTCNDVVDFLIENIEVKNTPISVNGISVSQPNSKGSIRGCHVHHCGKAGIYSATSAEYIVIENNIVHDITNAGQSGAFDIPCIQVIGGHNTRVINNVCYNSTKAGIYLITGGQYPSMNDMPYDTLIHGNVCYGHKDGIWLLSGTTGDNVAQETRAIISCNHMYGNTEAGIKVDARNNVIINGNICHDNTSGSSGLGIFLRGVSNVVITANMLYDNAYSGIQFDNCKNVVINSNRSFQYVGVQVRGVSFSGTASDKVTMVGNDFINVVAFVQPTNLNSGLNTDVSMDVFRLGSKLSPNPQKGSMYFDTTANKIKVYNGTTWETVTSV